VLCADHWLIINYFNRPRHPADHQHHATVDTANRRFLGLSFSIPRMTRLEASYILSSTLVAQASATVTRLPPHPACTPDRKCRMRWVRGMDLRELSTCRIMCRAQPKRCIENGTCRLDLVRVRRHVVGSLVAGGVVKRLDFRKHGAPKVVAPSPAALDDDRAVPVARAGARGEAEL
jgi:hypothetical protein